MRSIKDWIIEVYAMVVLAVSGRLRRPLTLCPRLEVESWKNLRAFLLHSLKTVRIEV